MISTPAARICGPPMPKIETSRRCLSAIARRAAYMSPEASPAERRSGMGGMSDGAEISRWLVARKVRPSGWPRSEGVAPALCIATDKGDSKFRAQREALDARLAHASGLCGIRGCGPRVEWCSAGARLPGRFARRANDSELRE